jgi:hypothetical protein
MVVVSCFELIVMAKPKIFVGRRVSYQGSQADALCVNGFMKWDSGITHQYDTNPAK